MNKHLNDTEIFELANDLVEDNAIQDQLEAHVSACQVCAAEVAKEKELNELLTEKLMVSKTVDVSEKVTQHFSLKEFSKESDVKWVLYTILGLAGILTVMEMLDSSIISIAEHITTEHLYYMRLILSATATILFVDVFTKYIKYRKRLAA